MLREGYLHRAETCKSNVAFDEKEVVADDKYLIPISTTTTITISIITVTITSDSNSSSPPYYRQH